MSSAQNDNEHEAEVQDNVARFKADEILVAVKTIQELDLEGLRHAGGLTLERAAKIAGTSLRNYWRWEKHEALPHSFDGIKRICQYVRRRSAEIERRLRLTSTDSVQIH
jgi:DNA-binding transcriptional regulator YiaG